ncbi:unnamed protein product [Mycena citricolor]|uniref:Uncharacterized protein n=1 Tax=Mycena citricolor TaxID=2018698 RepID=A0AAD2HMQ4_9AGAR|nr:unnamed protein product [Mycena citricolor]
MLPLSQKQLGNSMVHLATDASRCQSRGANIRFLRTFACGIQDRIGKRGFKLTVPSPASRGLLFVHTIFGRPLKYKDDTPVRCQLRSADSQNATPSVRAHGLTTGWEARQARHFADRRVLPLHRLSENSG